MSPTYFSPNSPSGKKIAEAIDRLKARKSSLRLSNKQIADNTGGRLSESAVQRFFSGDAADPSMQTFIEITAAMGMTLIEAFGEHVPAEMEHHTECAAVRTHYEARLADTKENYNARIAEMKELHSSEIARLNKWLIVAFSALAVVIGAIMFFVLYDVTHPTIGWVQYSRVIVSDPDTTTSPLVDWIRRVLYGIL